MVSSPIPSHRERSTSSSDVHMRRTFTIELSVSPRQRSRFRHVSLEESMKADSDASDIPRHLSNTNDTRLAPHRFPNFINPSSVTFSHDDRSIASKFGQATEIISNRPSSIFTHPDRFKVLTFFPPTTVRISPASSITLLSCFVRPVDAVDVFTPLQEGNPNSIK